MSKYKKEIELTKVSINLPINLVNEVKEYALEIGLTTTSAYTILLKKGLNVENFMKDNAFPLESLKQDIKYIVLQEPIDYQNSQDN